ncbi:MAG: thermonuclease family protein, partial [Acidimicrobiia bacterium]
MKVSKFAWLLVVLGCNLGGGVGSSAPPTSISFDVAVVVEVADGDSFRIQDREIRLVGVNAPEREECFGPESREWLTGLLEGNDVEIGSVSIDQFDRQLAAVSIDGRSV